jgi:hypothetical protein
MSYKYNISGVTLDDKIFGNLANVSIANAFRNMGKHFEGVAIGAISEKVTINSGPTKGTGTISIATGNMADADTVTINSVVLTAKTTPTVSGQFKIGSTALQTAINLRNLINSLSTLNSLVVATYAKGTVTTTGVVTVTALGAGTAGNYTWSQSGSNVTLSPASAMGGGATGPVAATATITSTGSASNGETALVCNQTLTAKTSGAVAANGEFNISGTVGTQAANIAAAINAVAALKNQVTASALAGVVTITSLVPGTIGNGLQISESLTNVTATAFAGGTDALVQTFSKGV